MTAFYYAVSRLRICECLPAHAAALGARLLVTRSSSAPPRARHWRRRRCKHRQHGYTPQLWQDPFRTGRWRVHHWVWVYSCWASLVAALSATAGGRDFFRGKTLNAATEMTVHRRARGSLAHRAAPAGDVSNALPVNTIQLGKHHLPQCCRPSGFRRPDRRRRCPKPRSCCTSTRRCKRSDRARRLPNRPVTGSPGAN